MLLLQVKCEGNVSKCNYSIMGNCKHRTYLDLVATAMEKIFQSNF